MLLKIFFFDCKFNLLINSFIPVNSEIFVLLGIDDTVIGKQNDKEDNKQQEIPT